MSEKSAAKKSGSITAGAVGLILPVIFCLLIVIASPPERILTLFLVGALGLASVVSAVIGIAKGSGRMAGIFGIFAFFLGCLMIFTVVNDLIAYHQAHSNAIQSYNQGLVALQEGEYAKAITAYTEAIRLDPEYADAYNDRGLAYANRAYDNRGITYARKGEFAKAVADGSQAIRLNPNEAKFYNNRGSIYVMMQEFGKAIADCTEAIRINPQYAKAYANRGLAYGNNDEYEKAIADFTDAIRLDPEFAGAYDYRAKLYRAVGDEAKALNDEKKASELMGKAQVLYREESSEGAGAP